MSAQAPFIVTRHTFRGGSAGHAVQDRHLQDRWRLMRDPRYRFSDDVRATTRAIALRMIHAGAVAASPEELDAWIARTEDVRERLTKGGYGSAFAADDLFPLFQSFAARATAARPAPSGARPSRWLWIGVIVVVVAIAIVAIVLQ